MKFSVNDSYSYLGFSRMKTNDFTPGVVIIIVFHFKLFLIDVDIYKILNITVL
jgi:hypothetical protein